MPYYESDPDLFEEDPPSGPYYVPEQVTFNFDMASRFTKSFREFLHDCGFTAVRCHYDGGHDEGFAYFDYAIAAMEVSADSLIEQLKSGLGAEIVELMYSDTPEPYRQNMLRRLKSTPMELQLRDALDEFARVLANALLGDGFGTGEFTLRGRFRADLRTGLISDLKDEE